MFRLLAVLIVIGVGCAVWMVTVHPPEVRRSTFAPTPHARISRNPQQGGFQLDEEFYFIDAAGEKWKAPKGTFTDGASIPQAALAIFGSNFSEKFLDAAVVHDAYCGRDNVDGESYQKRPPQAVHRMFYEAALTCGASSSLAKMMYAGVLLGGPSWKMTPEPPAPGVPNFNPQRALVKVPEKPLRREVAWCSEWIEAENPSIDEVEKWTQKRRDQLEVLALAAQVNLTAKTFRNAEPSGGSAPFAQPAEEIDFAVPPPDWTVARKVLQQNCQQCHATGSVLPLPDKAHPQPGDSEFWRKAIALLESDRPHPDARSPQPIATDRPAVVRWANGRIEKLETR